MGERAVAQPQRRPANRLLATLALVGLRISELCALDGEDLDFAGRRISFRACVRTATASWCACRGSTCGAPSSTRQLSAPTRCWVRDQREIARCTPHTLRRTFASILAELNLPPRRAMYLIGHTDPTLTMRVYQQVIDMGEGGLQTLEKLTGCTLDEAFALLSARGVWQPIGNRPTKMPPSPVRGASWKARKRRDCWTFFEAAEGTRTLDLLHGKQTL
jgi:Phage integrase family